MQRSAGKLVFSPSDLIKFMESEYITWIDRPPALIQLSCYADLLALIQGVTPKRVHIVLGDKRVRSFRT